jgi:polyferredoxin
MATALIWTIHVIHAVVVALLFFGKFIPVWREFAGWFNLTVVALQLAWGFTCPLVALQNYIAQSFGGRPAADFIARPMTARALEGLGFRAPDIAVAITGSIVVALLGAYYVMRATR